MPYKMRYNFEIWRFFTPMLLHANFAHLFFNCFSQLIFGSRLEFQHGSKLIMIVYGLTGFGGVLFSCLINDTVSVGASAAIYGLLGSILGFLILNWNTLDFPGSPRN